MREKTDLSRRNVFLSEEDWEKLRVRAFNDRRSISEIIREAIAVWLEENKDGKED